MGTAKRKTTTRKAKEEKVEEMASFGIFLHLAVLCFFIVRYADSYGYNRGYNPYNKGYNPYNKGYNPYNRATNANSIANGGGGGDTNANSIANGGGGGDTNANSVASGGDGGDTNAN